MIFFPGFVSFNTCLWRHVSSWVRQRESSMFTGELVSKQIPQYLKGFEQNSLINGSRYEAQSRGERGRRLKNTKIHALESIFCFVLFLFLLAEEQLSKACPCGKCSSFDCENLPRDDVSSHSRDKRQEGCVLLSSWLTEEIKAVTSFQVLKRPPGITEFTYSSPKVS